MRRSVVTGIDDDGNGDGRAVPRYGLRPRRRYEARERGETGRDDAEAHHGDARVLGDGRGGRRRRESTMNSSRGRAVK